MEKIEIAKYLKLEPYRRPGRPGYNRVNMLKTVLLGFMDTGYASLRRLEDRCKTNIRYMYLMDCETPTYRAFSYFINEEINESVQDIFKAVMEYIAKTDGVDFQRLFSRITELFAEMNETLAYTGLKIETNTEYVPDGLEAVLNRYAFICHVDEKRKACIGMRTGDNEKFLRVWFEVSRLKICFDAHSAIEIILRKSKWIPYNKGGEYRKWYGNQEYIVNWKDDGADIKENTRKVYPVYRLFAQDAARLRE